MTAGEEDPRGLPAPEKIDLNDLVRRGDVDVSIKSTESEGDARVRRFKEQLTFILAASMTAIVFLVCLSLLLLDTRRPKSSDGYNLL